MQSRYSRLLILRVDLSWNDEHKSDVTADIARQCRQRLFRNMKKNLTCSPLISTPRC
ncbi:hypothetical protein D9T11_02755 [Enterobacter kobei]|nr:hypothetical protein D9T11_02755 [Enterobacter kobei]